MPAVLDRQDMCGEELFDAYRGAVSQTFVPLQAVPTSSVASFRCRLCSSDLGLVQVSEVQATPHVVRRVSGEGAGFLKLGLQVTGTALLRQDGRTARLTPGNFAVYDTTRPYELEFRDNYRTVVLMFRRNLLRLPSAQLRDMTARPVSGSQGSGALLVPLLTALSAEHRGAAEAAGGPLGDAVLSLTAASLSSEAAYEPRTGDRLSTLRESAKVYIARHLDDRTLDVSSVAQVHHVSVRYLQRAFADEAESVAGYIRAQRLERCADDLTDPRQQGSAAAIGARWSFVDPGHFSRVFRARYGVPPAEFRARYRGPLATSLGPGSGR